MLEQQYEMVAGMGQNGYSCGGGGGQTMTSTLGTAAVVQERVAHLADAGCRLELVTVTETKPGMVAQASDPSPWAEAGGAL